MCLREIRSYTTDAGTTRRVERIRLCEDAIGQQTCNDVRRREYPIARVEEVRPAASKESSDDIIVRKDKHGREVTYRRVTRAEEKRPARYTSSPVPPSAPSPPRSHTHTLSPDLCPRIDCPLGRDFDELSPLSSSYNDFLQALPDTPNGRPRQVRTTIKVPSDLHHSPPLLSTPPPPRKKILKPEHKRHDSAKSLPKHRSPSHDPMEGPSERRRARFDEVDADRALAIELDRLERSEAARAKAEAQLLREEAVERAQLCRQEEDRAAARLDRQRQAEAALTAARVSAERRAQHERAANQSESQHNRLRYEEDRARNEEREESEQRRAAQASRPQVLVIEPPAATIPARRRGQRVVLHQEDTRDIAMREPEHARSASGNVIIREQLRMEQEERQGLRSIMDDDPLGIEDVGTTEYATGERARRVRMRRYREDERRRYG